MKKLMIMAALAALSTGVFAEPETYQYTWTVTVTHLENLDPTVTAETALTKIPSDLTAYLVDYNQPDSTTVFKYKVYSTLQIASNTGVGKKAAQNSLNGVTVTDTYSDLVLNDLLDDSNLKTVLISTMKGYWQSLDTHYSDTTSKTTFGATAAFHNIPEPTSGILLLLGVAGLALKRKRCA